MRPQGLILDFGGIIALSEKNPGWEGRAASEIAMMLGANSIPHEQITSDLGAAATAYSLWRDAMSRPRSPLEIDAGTYVHDFITADWPTTIRETLIGRESEICTLISHHQVIRTLRPGIREILQWCSQEGMPVSIASNALSGQVHRAFNAEHGLSQYIAAEIYSDEAGVRKPNPQLITLAAEAIGLDAGQCWYVGDRLDRDILCGKRAGVLSSILIPVPGAPPRPYSTPLKPDREFAEPSYLLGTLQNL